MLARLKQQIAFNSYLIPKVWSSRIGIRDCKIPSKCNGCDSIFVAAQDSVVMNTTCTCGASRKALLSAMEVAEMLKIEYKTLLCWRSLGKSTPTAILVGGVLRYREEDVLDWILDKREIGGLV